MRVPKAPEMSATGAAWAVCLGVVIYLGTMLLYLVWRPLAFVPSVALLLGMLYLVGGELWNKRRAR